MNRTYVRMRKLTICVRESCGNTIKRNAAFYCSQTCQLSHQYEQYIRKWKRGDIEGTTTTFDKPSMHIRRHLMETSGAKCSVCGWSEVNPKTGRVPLHVDHIDGNARNNRPGNLRLLCPNHHALTETFGKCNVGHGRAGRRARYMKGVKFSPLVISLSSNFRRPAAAATPERTRARSSARRTSRGARFQ